ncbi:hypothetical protein F4777DRAFT_361565 [Nemania sp. FL0916]|nr:hypothetical protein F4777DRAFT_361565 [Nemania sp. FL0916]
MAGSGAAVSPATYDLIHTWIGRQKEAPAPLTDNLRSALVGLEYALKAEAMSVSLAEPEIGDQNWIGLLQEYRAAHPVRGSIEVNFNEGSVDLYGRGQPLRWKCSVSIHEAPGAQFPPSGSSSNGHDAGAANHHQPTFARKKDAKKYAAKCAVDWLRAHGYMPESGGVKFPKPLLQHPQPQKQRLQQQQTPAGVVGQKRRAETPADRERDSNGRDSTALNAKLEPSGPTATARVAELCTSLGYHAPAYRTEPTGDGFFNGWADFGVGAALLPFDAAEVSRINDSLGKKETRELVAEKLLVPLRAEKQARAAATEAFMAQYKAAENEGGGGGGGAGGGDGRV